MCIRKRLEPMVPPATLNAKSWDTLPLLTMELDLERDPLNKFHHRLLQNANWMKITLIGSYNMFIPFEKEYLYTAATKAPLYGESVSQPINLFVTLCFNFILFLCNNSCVISFF